MCGILEENRILLDIDCCDKKEVIQLLCDQLKQNHLIENGEMFYKEVIERENMFPTSIGKWIAIPHGLSQNVVSPSICFGRLKKPVLWNEDKQEYVKIVILIAVPKQNENNIHIHIISHLMRKLIHDEYIEKLLIADKNDIYQMLRHELELV